MTALDISNSFVRQYDEYCQLCAPGRTRHEYDDMIKSKLNDVMSTLESQADRAGYILALTEEYRKLCEYRTKYGITVATTPNHGGRHLP